MEKKESLIKEVLRIASKELLIDGIKYSVYITIALVMVYYFGKKSLQDIFFNNSTTIELYANVKDLANKGDIVELYPTSIVGKVTEEGFVKWASTDVDFNILSNKNIELRQVLYDKGKKNIHTLAEIQIKDKPILAFLLGGK